LDENLIDERIPEFFSFHQWDRGFHLLFINVVHQQLLFYRLCLADEPQMKREENGEPRLREKRPGQRFTSLFPTDSWAHHIMIVNYWAHDPWMNRRYDSIRTTGQHKENNLTGLSDLIGGSLFFLMWFLAG